MAEETFLFFFLILPSLLLTKIMHISRKFFCLVIMVESGESGHSRVAPIPPVQLSFVILPKAD